MTIDLSTSDKPPIRCIYVGVLEQLTWEKSHKAAPLDPWRTLQFALIYPRCYGFVLPLGVTPAAVAPAPAAVGAVETFLLLLNSRLTMFVEGTIATRANHGVAQTLKTSLRGSKAFVMAQAVATL